jgi:hypothetical protein
MLGQALNRPGFSKLLDLHFASRDGTFDSNNTTNLQTLLSLMLSQTKEYHPTSKVPLVLFKNRNDCLPVG